MNGYWINVIKHTALTGLLILPLIIFSLKNKGLADKNSNPLALAGRKVYENSGCSSCHTAYLRKTFGDLVRYVPDEYFKINLNTMETLSSRIDRTGLRIGPDLEHLPDHILIDQFLTEYLKNPGSLNSNSIMPSYAALFGEKLRDDEILFASGSLKNKVGYSIYTRGEALLYYLKISTHEYFGRSQ